MSHDSQHVVIHLANDAFLYVAEDAYGPRGLVRKNVQNYRHLTCPVGWAQVDKASWEAQLLPFEQFVRQWFGYDDDRRLQKMMLYHDERNRVDLLYRCPESHISFEFSFEPFFPVDPPDDFWQ